MAVANSAVRTKATSSSASSKRKLCEVDQNIPRHVSEESPTAKGRRGSQSTPKRRRAHFIEPSDESQKHDDGQPLTVYDDEHNLVLLPFSSTRPNIFYGTGEGISDTFSCLTNDEDLPPKYFAKELIMAAYKIYRRMNKPEEEDPYYEFDDIDYKPYVVIMATREDVLRAEARALEEWFKGQKHTWWFEVSLTRSEPTNNPRRMKVWAVWVELSRHDRDGCIDVVRDLGMWWMTMEPTDDETQKSIARVLGYIF